MTAPLAEKPSASWRAALRRFGELLVVYGHGLFAYGVGKMFTGAIDHVTGAAISLAVACHAFACYIASRLEAADER